MDLKNRIQKIISYFEKIKKEEPRCGELLCGTCGGYGSAVEELISEQMYVEILSILERITSLDEINLFGEWEQLLRRRYFDELNTAYVRSDYYFGKSIDLDDLEAVKDFLIKKEWDRRRDSSTPQLKEFVKFAQTYDFILETSIKSAINRGDVNFIKSILSILRRHNFQYLSQTIEILYYQGTTLDLKDIRAVDSFLFNNRKFRKEIPESNETAKFIQVYDKILKKAIGMAIETQDASLSESLFIIMEHKAFTSPDLIGTVLNVCPDRITKRCLKMFSTKASRR